MKKLGTKWVKALKILHVALAVMWAGGALSMMAVMLLTEVTDASSMLTRAQVLKAIDDYLIIVGANGCIVTGILYGALTNWGFFRHRWITAKWVLTVLMVASGTFLMGPCVNGNVLTSDASVYQQNVEQTIFWGWVQIVLLIAVLVLSVWKPRMK